MERTMSVNKTKKKVAAKTKEVFPYFVIQGHNFKKAYDEAFVGAEKYKTFEEQYKYTAKRMEKYFSVPKNYFRGDVRAPKEFMALNWETNTIIASLIGDRIVVIRYMGSKTLTRILEDGEDVFMIPYKALYECLYDMPYNK